MKVGFIGLGHMGGPMSRNVLTAGHDLVVYDVRREAAAELEAAGATWAASPRAAGADRDVVITMLPRPEHVEQVLLGTDGLLGGMAPGSVWIDMSTSIPMVADRVRAAVLARPGGQVAVLDAPVSGMAAGAKAGTLQIFVGGDEAVCNRVRPLLEAMGDPDRILYVGGNGAGYTVKLMINLLWFAHLVATAEVLSIGTQAGVDLATLRRCLLASPAASNFLENDVLSVLDNGDYDESFALALACKDLGLAVDLAGQVGVPVEVSAVVEQIYRRARAQYGDDGGEMLPVKLYEDLTRAQLRLLQEKTMPNAAHARHRPQARRLLRRRVGRHQAATELIVRETGADAVMIVTDAALAQTPVIGTATYELAEAEIPVHVFTGVHPNPTTDDLAAGAAALAEMGVTEADGKRVALVAVGGGSPIDAAKGIALAAVNPRRGRDLDYRNNFAVPGLPIVAVPTTAGTGAETNAFGVVVPDTETHRKFYRRPRHATM